MHLPRVGVRNNPSFSSHISFQLLGQYRKLLGFKTGGKDIAPAFASTGYSERHTVFISLFTGITTLGGYCSELSGGCRKGGGAAFHVLFEQPHTHLKSTASVVKKSGIPAES
jgi:hypothetical protein